MVMTIVRVTLVFAGTAAYLGLAMLGEGGWTAFCTHLALVALAVVLFVLAGVSLVAGGNLSRGLREDRGNRWVIGALGLLGLLAAYLAPYTDRKAFWIIDGEPMRWLGVVLFAAGGALRIWPVFVLGHRFSGLVAIQPGHTLVTSGVYGVIRNPSYLGLLVNALGWGLAFRAGLGVLLTALMIPPLLARIRAEERLLHSRLATSMTPTAPGQHGCFPGSISDARTGSRSPRPNRGGVMNPAEPPKSAGERSARAQEFERRTYPLPVWDLHGYTVIGTGNLYLKETLSD